MLVVTVMDGNVNITDFTTFRACLLCYAKAITPSNSANRLSFIMCVIALASQTVFIFLPIPTTGHEEKSFMIEADTVQQDFSIDRAG